MTVKGLFFMPENKTERKEHEQMNKYFAGVKTVEELRKRYRELLKKYHPDNDGGSVEITQEINAEYDRIFAILSNESKTDEECSTEEEKAANEAFKAVLDRFYRR